MDEVIFKGNETTIGTPQNTTAKYVYTDGAGYRIYYDGMAYWTVDNNKVEYYD